MEQNGTMRSYRGAIVANKDIQICQKIRFSPREQKRYEIFFHAHLILFFIMLLKYVNSQMIIKSPIGLGLNV